MADEFSDLSKIRHVQPGDPVAAKETSQPTRALELRLNKLEELVASISQSSEFSKLVIRNVPIKTGITDPVVVDDVVYYNANTGLYEKAIAGVTFTSGVYTSNPTALAVGICVAVNGAFGDIMIDGFDAWRDDAHKAHMLEDLEIFLPGVPYYLSATQLGKLTRFPPPMQIQVIVATDTHYVLKPAYTSPDTLDTPIKQAIGMRPVGGLRLNPPGFEQLVIVGFDALELYSPDLSHDGYGSWRNTLSSSIVNLAKYGYMVADAQVTLQPVKPVYIRVSVAASTGAIKVCQSALLANLDYEDPLAYNKVSSLTALSGGGSVATIRTYQVRDSDNVTVLGTLYFKFVDADVSFRRDVIFKFPDTFQGWKMVNAPVTPLATAVVTGGVVTNILVQEGGIGYSTPPVVVITGDGTGAAAEAILNESGSIASINVTAPGTGYTTATISFLNKVILAQVLNGGLDGAGTVALVSGVGPRAIGSLTLTNPGSGYLLPPAAVIVDRGGTGFGATVSAVVREGVISELNLNNPGSNYTDPVLIIRPNANFSYIKSKAPVFSATVVGGVITAVSVVDGGFANPPGYFMLVTDSPAPSVAAVLAPNTPFGPNGEITGVAVVSGGTGYTAPTVTYPHVSDPTLVATGGGPDAAGFAGTIALSGMGVERVDILCGGIAYDPATTVTFSAPTGASPVTATAIVKTDIDGHITDIVITKPGNGYLKPPTLTLTDPGGNGAQALFKVVIGASVQSIAITNPGSGFTEPPTLAAGCVIDHYEVDDGGAGYSTLSRPTFTVSPPDDPAGVQATVSVEVGQSIASVVIDSGGTGYDDPSDWKITITGGSHTGGPAPAKLIPIISGGSLVAIEVVDGGSEYASTPTLSLDSISGTPIGTPSGAAMTPVMEGLDRVSRVLVEHAGSGYTKPPTVTCNPPLDTQRPALVTAKLRGFGAALQASISGYGGIRFPQAAPLSQGNGLQIYDYGDDLNDSPSAPLKKPQQGVFYYNIKNDLALKAKYPSIPPEKSLFILNGSELTVTPFNEVSGLGPDIDADLIMCRKSPFWTTFDVNGSPWDAQYLQYVIDQATDGIDHVIPKSGPFNFPDAWFRFWEHVFKYEVSRNRAWLHLNRGSRFFQTGRVLSLGVLPPFQLYDVTTGAQAKNDGSPLTGQLLLTFDNQSPFLTGNTGAQVDMTKANSLVSIYKNNTGRPLMISSIVLLVSYQVNLSSTIIPTVADDARITVGTTSGNYRDIVGTVDPSLLTQQGAETKLYAANQVKEIFPDARDAAPLILPDQEIFLRVDSPTSNNIQTQLVTARVRGYLF